MVTIPLTGMSSAVALLTTQNKERNANRSSREHTFCFIRKILFYNMKCIFIVSSNSEQPNSCMTVLLSSSTGPGGSVLPVLFTKS
jgi:hypothetical protein